MSTPSNENMDKLLQEYERYQRQCFWMKVSAAMTCPLALSLHMALSLAVLLIILMWVQESIWRNEQNVIAKRLAALNQPGMEPTKQADSEGTASWQNILAAGMQPKVGYPYMILFGLEMTLFGFGLWPG